MFKKGDKVYSILRGWGEVEGVQQLNNGKYVMDVKFKNGDWHRYFGDGRNNELDLIPELYHAEPTITVPKRRVEHKGWIAVANDKTFDVRNTSPIYPAIGRLDEYTDGRFAIQEITYYTEE